MAEGNKRALDVFLGWRHIVVYLIAMVVATGLALSLIPQLSLNAAIRGGTIAIGAFLFTQLGLRLYVRYKQRNRRD